jgi:stage II sporulation protein M
MINKGMKGNKLRVLIRSTKGDKIMTNGKPIINFNNHIQENFWLYVISLLCIFTGIILGIYTVKYMGNGEKGDIVNYLSNFSQNVGQDGFKYKTIFTDVLKNNISVILVMWFLGLTMVGIPVILVIDVIKGFTIGFSISFLINGLGTKGIGIVLLGILPQNIIYIPCIVISSVIAMEFSLSILRDKINKQRVNSIWMKITSYSFIFILVSVFMSIGFVFETYLTPTLIKLIL